MRYVLHSIADQWRALRRWVISSFLLLLLSGCGSIRPVLVRALVDPPPANLAQPCLEGPPIPTRDTRLYDGMEVWQAREVAAAECRDRHRRLVEAWPK